LLVGAGNSDAEIALELSRDHQCLLAGPKAGEIGVQHGTLPARLGFRVFRFVGHRVLKLDNPIGRKAAPKLASKAAPLIRVRSQRPGSRGRRAFSASQRCG
jgi:putative flavoprotein involved in K+ transport